MCKPKMILYKDILTRTMPHSGGYSTPAIVLRIDSRLTRSSVDRFHIWAYPHLQAFRQQARVP
jgi:hypothetical protein